ncbi:hypothetical protein LEP1GSC193_2363 [Leptospira alstonii serovar Pingchang str. 80-412]|uniref:Uncharacterized protein n=2 Tax=Leptospira alstonii TaxID=28452 RepID=M6DHU3_9LEPT|nr:hypothetical protein LEP1GSC194_2400 [Leptospira alstonii serovar Sichuan str. 79601]EQA80874.1 hypothetical protein LEP1GSC193_2363 [Leptospira alstonii serovar Pingchang str. 80-412]
MDSFRFRAGCTDMRRFRNFVSAIWWTEGKKETFFAESGGSYGKRTNRSTIRRI